MHFLPNAIDLDLWDTQASAPMSIPMSISVDPNRRNLVVVGRIAPEKNQRAVVQALGALGPEAKAWSLWLLGEDTTHPQYVAALRADIHAAGLADRVHLLAPRQDVAGVMRQMTALLLPSTREGFPNVLLEAMAIGLPVVAAPVGEVPHIVTDRATGLLLADASSSSIATGIDALSSMASAELDALAERGRDHVRKHYAADTVAEQHRNLYQTCVANA